MRESLKIVRQALDKITDDGAIKAEAPGIVPPQREKMKTEMEALIYHFKIFTEGFSPPAGEAFVTVESPRGELGCFIASDGSPKPLRVHFRSPSFINLQALPKLVEGQLISDVIACIGTIDIVLWRGGSLDGNCKCPPTLTARFERLQNAYPVKRSALIPMLMYAQDEFGYISDEVIAEIAARLELRTVQVEETLEYYSMLRRKPMGKYHVQVCTNVACMLRGGSELLDRAKKRLEIGHKEITEDGMFSLEEVECIGACTGRAGDAG